MIPAPFERHEETARQLMASLVDASCKTVLLCAPSASGKTKLCQWVLEQVREQEGRQVIEWSKQGAETAKLPAIDAWLSATPPIVFFDDVDVAVRSVSTKGALRNLVAQLHALPARSKVLLTCTVATGRAGGGPPASLVGAVDKRIDMHAQLLSTAPQLPRLRRNRKLDAQKALIKAEMEEAAAIMNVASVDACNDVLSCLAEHIQLVSGCTKRQ